MSSHSKQRPYFLCDNPIVKMPQYMADTVAGKELNRVDESDFVLLPCGKCDHCLEKKAKEWGHRMLLESKVHSKMAYVTLTFNDENLKDPSLNKREMQLFLKRLRKALNGRKIRYYIVGEYGPLNLRKHYHIILYNVDGTDLYNNFARLKSKLPIVGTNTDWHIIHDTWKNFGFSKIEVPRGGAFHYLAGYVTKISKRRDEIEKAGLEPEFRMMSKGLGKKTMENMSRQIKQKKRRGIKLPLQYLEYGYKDKITGKRKVIKRGIGRYLKKILHENMGMESILHMWNKLQADIIRCEYGFGGINTMDAQYLLATQPDRDFANWKRTIKDIYT